MSLPARPLAIVATIGLVAIAATGAWAGSPDDPEISDATGDVSVNGNPPPEQAPDPLKSGDALRDSVDISGIWFAFPNASALTVGVQVASLNGQEIPDDAPNQGQLTFNINYQFHRPPDANISGWSSVAPQDQTVTISTELDGTDTPECSGTAARDNGGNTLTCTLPSSNFVGDQFGGQFFDGDMVMFSPDTSSTSSGTYGALSASDSANATSAGAYVMTGVNPKPAPDQDGGGDGDDGGGDTNTTTSDEGGGESTPGFASVVAVASLIAVALWARDRD